LESLFRRKDKIKKKNEISFIFQNGKKCDCIQFRIFYIKNNYNFDRCGIIVSKRIGNSIKRNKTKRILRELFRSRRKINPPYFDVLIQPRPGIEKKNRTELINCFEKWKIAAKE
jgi:ribonuclease P protein component